MSYKAKVRLICVQTQLKIARKALQQIACGQRNPEGIASQAIDAINAEDFKEGGKSENYTHNPAHF